MSLQRGAESLSKKGLLGRLFVAFLKIGAFTWGGGYAMLPLIKRELVEKNRFLSEEEFIEGVSVAQSLPGAIAINTACFVGRKLAGGSGALVSLLGSALPSFVVILVLATVFLHYRETKYIRDFFYGATPAIAALIGAAVLDFGKSALKHVEEVLIAGLLFLFVFLFDLHPLWVVVLGGVLGLVRKR